MNKQTIILTLLVLIALAVFPVQANTITLANPGGIAERDIIVYHPNGTMYGYYNSTSVITLVDGDSYIFSMKPMSTTPLDDPGDWLSSLIAWANTNAVVLFFIAVLIGVAMARRR